MKPIVSKMIRKDGKGTKRPMGGGSKKQLTYGKTNSPGMGRSMGKWTPAIG